MEPKRIAAVAALTVAMAAPAVAQPAPRSVSAQHRLQQERMYRHAHRPAYSYGYHPAYRYAYRYGTGFWPADVAAGHRRRRDRNGRRDSCGTVRRRTVCVL